MARTIPVTESSAAAGPPPFERIGIVGLGAIGGAIGLALRAAWRSVLIVGVDRGHVLSDVQRAHAVDVSADDLGMLADVDLIVLATPLEATLVLLEGLAERLSAGGLDVLSHCVVPANDGGLALGQVAVCLATLGSVGRTEAGRAHG